MILSPLLLIFIIVLEALSNAFRDGLSMELFYADDLVLFANSIDLLIQKIRRWNTGMEENGLSVNMGKPRLWHTKMEQAV